MGEKLVRWPGSLAGSLVQSPGLLAPNLSMPMEHCSFPPEVSILKGVCSKPKVINVSQGL